MLSSLIIGGVAGGVGVVIYALVIQRKLSCAKCGTKPPMFRKPASGREALAGGWTCASCGTALDRKGQPR